MIGYIIYVLAFIFFIWMLIDCIQNSSLDTTKKIVWVLVILFIPFLGPLLYYLVARKS